MAHKAYRVLSIILVVLVLVGLFALRRFIFGDELDTAVLAENGQAKQSIVVNAQASQETKDLADTLSQYLSKISGAQFQVVEGDGQTGIALGLSGDYNWPIKNDFDLTDPLRKEDYLLRSHSGGIYVAGASQLGLEHAAWDLLYHLGYRQYFPGPHWEIIPSKPNLSVTVNVTEHPNYLNRQIWYGLGTWDDNKTISADWAAKNRLGNGTGIVSGHNYQNIIRLNAAEFAAHPEYLGSKDGVPTTKFCVSQPGLQKLVVNFALNYFKTHPAAQSISMEPSDGAGWEGCGPEEDKLGSVSNRVVTLANLVATEVNKVYPGKYVGIYAYNQHSPAPTIRVEPQVVVNIATAYISNEQTIDELIKAWKKQGASVGIREYYSVTSWDRDRPGEAAASKLSYLAKTIGSFYNQGAFYLSAESGENFGPNGLGYYLASRWLWDTSEINQQQRLVDDFLDNSFGPARKPMADYYTLIDGSRQVRLSDDLLKHMYQDLADATQLTTDDSVKQRLNDLVLYTHYLELFRDYSAATTDRQARFETLIRYAYRIHPTMMVHSLALYRDLIRRDHTVTIPAEALYSVPEPNNPWKSSVQYTSTEISQFLQNGLSRFHVVTFEPHSYNSNKLIRADALSLPATDPRAKGSYAYSRWTQRFYVWVESGEITLKVKSNILRSSSKSTLSLTSLTEQSGTQQDQTTLIPGKDEVSITLKTQAKGLHVINLNDHGAGTLVTADDGTAFVMESSKEQTAHLRNRWTMYFYVPKETKAIGGYSTGAGQLKDSTGTTVFNFDSIPNYFDVPVGDGQDGKVWSFTDSLGDRALMTVPPYLATTAQQLLLPQSVVEGKDDTGEPSPSPDASPTPDPSPPAPPDDVPPDNQQPPDEEAGSLDSETAELATYQEPVKARPVSAQSSKKSTANKAKKQAAPTATTAAQTPAQPAGNTPSIAPLPSLQLDKTETDQELDRNHRCEGLRTGNPIIYNMCLNFVVGSSVVQEGLTVMVSQIREQYNHFR